MAVASATGVPRSTVRDWRRDGVEREPEVDRCGVCEAPRHDPAALDREAYAYVLGLYLGDGHVSAVRGGRTSRLLISVDARHPRLAEGIAATIARVHPGPRVGTFVIPRDHVRIVSQYSRAWPCLLPQHGSGPKHARPIVLAGWQRGVVEEHPEQLVRGLLHSDGCRTVNRVVTAGRTYRYGRYQLSNRSADIRALFCDALDQLGVPWRRMNGRTISIARREGVEQLDTFVEVKA